MSVSSLVLAIAIATQNCPSSTALPQPQQPALPQLASAAPQATAVASLSTKVDPKTSLDDMQSAIKDLIATNDRHGFAINRAQSARVRRALAGMSRDIASLQEKYRHSGPVEKAVLDAQVETLLDKHHARDKTLILSLKSKAIRAQGHECENFCWESCGHNSVGEWVCFLTCRRHCT